MKLSQHESIREEIEAGKIQMPILSSGPFTNPVIVPLGGFLGAGKTSLILAAAQILEKRGIRTAVILNDQGAELADTQWVQSRGIQADQVTGGCFCCLFSELIDAAERLRADSPKVIFAEAVGSCTDIAATTLQPLKLYYKNKFQLAPYTVLVDAGRARQLCEDGDADFAFLFEKQIEEADLICFSKSDVYTEYPELSGAPIRYLSSLTGAGVDAWLDEILAGALPSGSKVLDIDYVRYARAEARLAWLNCKTSVILEPDAALAPPALVGPLLENLESTLSAEGFHIAHLKLTDESSTGILKASVVTNGELPMVEGDLSASPARVHELLLNVRAAGDPATLERVVRSHLCGIQGKLDIQSIQCFKPSPLVPEHRLSQIANASAG